MAARADILEFREPLGKFFVGSLVLHAAIFGAAALYTYSESRGRATFGSAVAGGGAVTVTPVSQINIPSLGGIPNPVASDTQSRVPAPPPKPAPREKAPEPDRDAVAIKGRKRAQTPSEVAASQQKYRPKGADREHQLYASGGQAMSSPMMSSTATGGGVGSGPSGSLGTRFGWYEQLLRERVARAWQNNPQWQTPQPAIIIFELMRDGSVRNIRFLQRSGNYEFDTSAQRAIMQASPFPQLPQGFERSSAHIEFWFQAKR
jgi:TonB family protein